MGTDLQLLGKQITKCFRSQRFPEGCCAARGGEDLAGQGPGERGCQSIGSGSPGEAGVAGGQDPSLDNEWREQPRERSVTWEAVVLARVMSEPRCGVGGVGYRQQKSWQWDREALVSLWTRWPDLIERFSELQGEKGEPGAILTGDVPLERLRGQKVIMSLDPEGTHPLRCPICVSAANCVPLSDKSASPCFRVNLECMEPRDPW